MPVFSLNEEIIFPHPVLREPEGLLAIGGDLSPERLLLAYRWGIFPWYNDDQPILWWWTTPRLMLKPEGVIISHSTRNALNKKNISVTIDQDFEAVMQLCGSISRKDQDSTWIIPEMLEAYKELFRLGHAHCIAVHDESGLIGGLYGIGMGKIFSGESMFALKPNASKIAFIHLCRYLAKEGYEWIDCQQDTPHLRSLGAILIEEEPYLEILKGNQKHIAS